MVDGIVYFVTGLAVVFSVFLGYVFLRSNGRIMNAIERNSIETDAKISFIQDRISSFTASVDTRLQENGRVMTEQTKSIDDRLKLFGELREKMVRMEESSIGIRDAGKELNSAIHNLKNIFTASKSRGISGEIMLENLLRQYVPGNYKMQYPLGNFIVDAVIFMGDFIVPIDAKFPYFHKFNEYVSVDDATEEGGREKQKYRREMIDSVKKMIADVSSKYIQPEKGTTNFAIIYIPAEHIYYEIFVNDPSLEVSQYALEHNVVLVSPSTILSYLYTVSMGLKGLKIEENSRMIYSTMMEMEKDFELLGKEMNTATKHMKNAFQKMEDTNHLVFRMHNRIELIGKREDDGTKKITDFE